MAAIEAVLGLGAETGSGEFPVPRAPLRSHEYWPWVMVLAEAAAPSDHSCGPDCPCWQKEGPAQAGPSRGVCRTISDSVAPADDLAQAS